MKLAIATITFIIILAGMLVGSQATGNMKDLLILSDKNTVNLRVPVTEESVKNLQILLMEKSNKLGRNVPIILVLNSPGGSIEAGKRLIETAKGLPQSINTLSLFSASMSFQISQALGQRYVMDNSTLMSHRAFLGGVEGQIPGSFVTRTNYILNDLIANDTAVAKRAGITLIEYQKKIADELWMHGNEAVEAKFADKLVRVRCDSSLQGPGEVEVMQIMFFRIKLIYHKCPLVTEPMGIEIQGGEERLAPQAAHVLQLLLNDKPGFIKEYVIPNRVQQFIK